MERWRRQGGREEGVKGEEDEDGQDRGRTDQTFSAEHRRFTAPSGSNIASTNSNSFKTCCYLGHQLFGIVMTEQLSNECGCHGEQYRATEQCGRVCNRCFTRGAVVTADTQTHTHSGTLWNAAREESGRGEAERIRPTPPTAWMGGVAAALATAVTTHSRQVTLGLGAP